MMERRQRRSCTIVCLVVLLIQLGESSPWHATTRRLPGWGVMMERQQHPDRLVRPLASSHSWMLLLRGGTSSEASSPGEEEEEEYDEEEEYENEEELLDDVREVEEDFQQDAQQQERIEPATAEDYQDGTEEEEEVVEEEAEVEIVMQMDEDADGDDDVESSSSQALDATPTTSSASHDSFTAESVLDDPSIDEDSSAFVDRMELADAYDEGVEIDSDLSDIETSETKQFEPTTEPVMMQESSIQEKESLVHQSLSESASSESPSIPVPTEITKEMAKQLRNELKYTRAEVAAMKPDVAAVVLHKQIHRPWEGIPDTWRVDQKAAAKKKKRSFGIKVAVPALVGALAIGAGAKSVDLDASDLISSISDLLPRRATSSKGGKQTTSSSSEPMEDPYSFVPVIAGEETAQSIPKQTSAPILPEEEESEVLPVNEHVNTLGESHPRSIKPGKQPEDELDVTWLDKGITAIERSVKGLFSK